MASTQILTDLALCVTTAPTAASVTKMNNPTGPIQDLTGMMQIALTAAQDCRRILTEVVKATDSSDPNLTRVNDILASLD